MSFIAGEDTRIRFWHDVWYGEQVLKELYPDLYLVA